MIEVLNTQCLNSYHIYKCITVHLKTSFNKGLVTQASSRTRQSTHRSYSFEFSNSNSTTVTKQHSKVENSKILYRWYASYWNAFLFITDRIRSMGENDVFTGVFVHRGRCVPLHWMHPFAPRKQTVNRRSVRILLQCILVL